MVVLSVVISIPIAWFHRIAEAGNCRLMFENEPDFTIKSKNMSGVLQEISSILTVDVTKIEDVPLIELSTCPKHPVDGHIYYNFFIITWSIGRRLKIPNQAEFKIVISFTTFKAVFFLPMTVISVMYGLVVKKVIYSNAVKRKSFKSV